MKKKPPRDCPCHSGRLYRECCGPFHAGAVPATAELLMRSRYCAFALGLAEYLYDTLHSRHEDRATPKDKLIFALRDGARTQRFMGLTILEHVEEADHAEVLFLASVFEAGRDNSFVELSRFEREDGAYRYLSGALVHAATLADPKSLTREAFLKLKPRA